MDILSLNKQLQNNTTTISVATYTSPLGEMFLGAVDKGICLVEFHDRIRLEETLLALAKNLNAQFVEDEHKHHFNLKNELDLYFQQKLQQFTIPLVLTGTEFQQRVFQSLIDIPFGNTSTYKKQATLLGDVKAIRAVATANGLNKIAIVVPCHRIIGSDGSMVGYAGGIHRKKALLQLEGALPQNQLALF
ncbi:methylated-DNA--[protein]-cysteine S-methyltransferase [Flavobacterium sp. xlx-214]|uniref:methylated-DNA--[protein]-cysteine S-methyltransferase n=1 Tax=unclassified Flavobacterium TaxID=196869 RepID=UPI0013D7C529|nr:methylated-DNA--[protein]-cysteine S-methyltransferase [Flavobacterium sp. xlx-214]MBA5791455.1 methylated-DNA--[protein]-cysteine S-methyltransferase [Flavobacterium sp. xlx-221]QMI83395.1 methylated-DNA--[protein]-cysteine S-methyltransferase [Flavobacterium sp. xlx-214]